MTTFSDIAYKNEWPITDGQQIIMPGYEPKTIVGMIFYPDQWKEYHDPATGETGFGYLIMSGNLIMHCPSHKCELDL